MNKSGIVLNIEKNKAYIMTSNGEFAAVKVHKPLPVIGEEFTGELITKFNWIKYTSIAASLFFLLFTGGAAYAYYTPVSSVVMDINPSIKVEANRWNRIIKYEPLNDDGRKLLENVDIKNKSLDAGLTIILQEAKKESFISSDETSNKGKQVNLYISGKDSIPDNLPEFKKQADASNLNLKINNNGKEADIPEKKDKSQTEKKSEDKKDKPETNSNIKDDKKNNEVPPAQANPQKNNTPASDTPSKNSNSSIDNSGDKKNSDKHEDKQENKNSNDKGSNKNNDKKTKGK